MRPHFVYSYIHMQLPSVRRAPLLPSLIQSWQHDGAGRRPPAAAGVVSAVQRRARPADTCDGLLKLEPCAALPLKCCLAAAALHCAGCCRIQVPAGAEAADTA
jgi:hypothetical protein